MSRILIADDHKSTREGLALALGGLGHSIYVAFDGEDAIAAVGKYSFDLAMVDIQMPKKRRWQRACWKASSSAMRKAHLPKP